MFFRGRSFRRCAHFPYSPTRLLILSSYFLLFMHLPWTSIFALPHLSSIFINELYSFFIMALLPDVLLDARFILPLLPFHLDFSRLLGLYDGPIPSVFPSRIIASHTALPSTSPSSHHPLVAASVIPENKKQEIIPSHPLSLP